MNEEMIEDIVEVEETISSSSQTIEEDTANPEILVDKNTGEGMQNIIHTEESAEQVIVKKKSKVLPLIILFTLLILDIVAIAIYIIGIDKVISFIK